MADWPLTGVVHSSKHVFDSTHTQPRWLSSQMQPTMSLNAHGMPSCGSKSGGRSAGTIFRLPRNQYARSATSMTWTAAPCAVLHVVCASSIHPSPKDGLGLSDFTGALLFLLRVDSAVSRLTAASGGGGGGGGGGGVGRSVGACET